MRWAAFLVLFASPVMAQTVQPCDWRASAQAIAEPWDEHTRTFANGAVRLVAIDTIEPAAGAAHLLVLTPPFSEIGDRTCQLVSWQQDFGFAAIYFSELTSTYDPARGLVFTLPAQIFDPETAFGNGALVTVTVNQATGMVAAELALGRE